MTSPTSDTSPGAAEPRDPPGDGAPTWRRTLWAMVGVQFVMNASFTITAPVLPLLLPQIGLSTANEVNLWAGILSGVTPLFAALLSPIWGRMSDRHGRKPALVRASCAIAVFTILMGLSTNVWQMLAIRSLLGVFAGFSASSIALVASQTPKAALGYSLGWLANGQIAGSLLGPVIGGAFADISGSYRAPFYISGVVILLTVFLIWRYVPEHFQPPAQGRPQLKLTASLVAVFATPGLAALIVVLLMAQFSIRTVEPIVALFVQHLVGTPAHLATLSGIALSIVGVANVVSSPMLGNRSDSIGYRRVLLICLTGAFLMCVPQIFVESYWFFVAERFGMGLFIGGVIPTANALVGRLVSNAERGSVYGVTASAGFIGGALGPMCGGIVAGALDLRWAFVVTAVFLLATLLWVYFRIDPQLERRAGVD